MDINQEESWVCLYYCSLYCDTYCDWGLPEKLFCWYNKIFVHICTILWSNESLINGFFFGDMICILGWYGIYALWKYLTSKYSNTLIWISGVLLTIGYTPSLFLLWRQTPVVDYPQERYALREDLLNNIENNDCSWTCYDMFVPASTSIHEIVICLKSCTQPLVKIFLSSTCTSMRQHMRWDPYILKSNNPTKIP